MTQSNATSIAAPPEKQARIAGEIAPDFNQPVVGAYGPFSAKAWDEAGQKPQALKDSPQGRAVIRMFSRGLLGTTAFALGSWYATKQMSGYAPHLDTKNWVQGIAKAFDYGAGKPIKAAVDMLGHDGEKFVNNFRPTAQYAGYAGKGRSLGHEVVMVTFDFATMSIGDFWGRKLAHTLDPNKERPKWKREDGSIDWAQAGKTFAKNWWSALTYSQGEDWAVAVPYCLTMRHLGTPALDKMFPGYKFEFDRNGNGGGLLINSAGKVTGNMTVPGVLNLWERFTTYNVGTLMFREAYHWLGARINHISSKHEMPCLVETNPAEPNRSTLGTMRDGALQFANWFTRSTVKAVAYMIPSVPFFWITRTPQHKFEGRFIHPEKGALLLENGAALQANMKDKAHAPVFFSETGERAINPMSLGAIEPNAKTWGVVDSLMNPIAKANDKVRTVLRKPFSKFYRLFDEAKAANMADTFINASIAYTPYFWAKSDWLADKWDTGRMDAALDRTIAGAAHFNPGEFQAGMHEVGRAFGGKPFADPVRERYANCRDATDSSPSDNKFDVNPVQGGNCDEILYETQHPSFAGRVGRSEPLKAKTYRPIAPEKAMPKIGFRERMIHGGKVGETIRPRGLSHAEAEEARKLLEDFNPPTNSIN